MSPEQIIQKQIAEEINLIPKEKRQQLYDLIHNFRVCLKQDKANKNMEFAGDWLDITEADFEDFNEEIEQRRQASRSRRFKY